MKRIASLVLALLLLTALPAHAVKKGASYIEDDCGQDPCVCFIQRGDSGGFVKGVIKLLKEKGYLNAGKVGQFTADVEKAVLQFQRDNKLPETGMLDDDTLTLLIWDMLPAKLDQAQPIVHGRPETFPDTVYVPTDGGKKHHSDPTCSDMYKPRKVSIRNAIALDYQACGKCMKEVEKTLH